ncbi:MAG TPA: hypothetical protein VF590_09750 [Isosphaeraceae bacterium]|jgi:hypothetical protein
MLDDQIRRLDDDAAVRILEAVAGARLHADEGAYQTKVTPELGRALREAFAVGPGDLDTAGRGDVARAALLVLAADPHQRPALDAFVRDPSAAPASLAFLEAAGATALIVAALVALQTRVTIRRDAKGTTTWTIDKKPTDLALLKPLVEKLLSLVK